ncbi:MAG TPA: hypothetical protein VM366_10510 [Anaerolineae bacterium]|nr:hypothetical protein [Anaerolineae bacterium]
MARRREYEGKAVYEIQVKGHLDDRWSEWFDGFTIVPQADEVTQLTGSVPDQAALHGLLVKIRNLGLPLLLVRRVKDKEASQ